MRSRPLIANWRSEAESGRCLDAGLAILAVVASQALHVTQRDAPPRLAPFVEMVRALVPPIVEPRALGPEIERLQALITNKVFAGVTATECRRSGPVTKIAQVCGVRRS